MNGNEHGELSCIPSTGNATIITLGNGIVTHLPGGRGTKITIRPITKPPRPYPSTVSGRVAGRLVRLLDNENDGGSKFFRGHRFLLPLPARLDNSPALRDCAALFASTWANFQRGLPCSEVTDRNLYGKALRSLWSALNQNLNEPVKSENLAAITIMDRYQSMFDTSRPLYWSTHRAGLIMLMKQAGPPDLEDELGCWVAIENQGNLVSNYDLFK